MIDQESRESRESRAWALLTARAASLERAGRAHGGLSQAEVAGMLAGLYQRAFEAGMLCEAGEWTYLSRVSDSLLRATLWLATREEWNLPRGPGQLRDLVDLALLEATGPTLPCTECGGTGRVSAGGDFEVVRLAERGDFRVLHRACDLCEGSGRIPRTQRSRADLISIGEVQWHRIWKTRYRGVYSELNNWVSDARRHLARALRERHRVPA